MKAKTLLGLTNALRAETEILHSSIVGRNSFGRLSDLVVTWADHHHQMNSRASGDIRLMLQALLEFTCPKKKQELGYFEFAVEEGFVYASVRFPNREFSKDTQAIGEEITHYWEEHDDAQLLKKVLYPHDRIEVRFHQKLNLIEWRVRRSMGMNQVQAEDSGFEFMVDEENDLPSSHEHYIDLGDLPYTDLLNEIYQSGQSSTNGSGEFYYKGSSIQEEDEQVRVLFERDKMEIDSQVNSVVKASMAIAQENIDVRLSAEEIAVVKDESKTVVKALTEKVDPKNIELKKTIEEMIIDHKKNEFYLKKETAQFQVKVEKLEVLLKQKELDSVKKKNTIKILNDKLEGVRAGDESLHQATFKEKAIQMYNKLKAVKEANEALEKANQELRQQRPGDGKDRGLRVTESQMTSVQVDDLTKKLDRATRALESEKAKVKGFFERMTIAEKEAQMAGPMIDDLERKVELATRTAQQHKKETEQVKQKLMKSDAEKNKLKNELRKSQAQVQTMLKRQAS